MFTYKFFINEARNNVLTLRVTNGRKKAECSLGLQMSSDALSDALSDTPKNFRLSKVLSSWIAEIRNYMVELADSKTSGIPAGDILREIKFRLTGQEQKKHRSNQGAFMKAYFDFMSLKSNPGTLRVYKHTLDRIKLFDPDFGLRCFEDIDLNWLNDFESFCAKTAKKNARNIHLRNIRAVFNFAIDYEMTSCYPFRRFKIRPEATRKRAMTVAGLRELATMPVEPYAEIYRDMFLLSFMLIGINPVDLYGLKHTSIDSDGIVEYKRAKTHRPYSVKVEPEAMAIINKYKGVKGLVSLADRWTDYRNFIHQCNKALKRLGMTHTGKRGALIGEARWPDLSLYWARHTWATIAAYLDIPKETIAAALGHGGNSVTDIYIDFDRRKVDAANRRVLDYVFGEGE